MRYTVILEKGREVGYVAVCPVLRGCISQGRTKRAVIKNIREAIDAYIAALIKDCLLYTSDAADEL